MTIRRSSVDEAITNLIDLIESQRDPVVRLAHYTHAHERVLRELVAGRNEAAYASREKATIEQIASAVGSEPRNVSFWSIRHANLNGLPAPRRHDRADLSGAVEILASEGLRRPIRPQPHPAGTDEDRG
jgi:hypothetical protein